jgi:predicted AAA+ superfamily ATPase
MEIKRSITNSIHEALDKKIVLLAGPRQVGKTFLSKHLVNNFSYYNFDSGEDRHILRKQTWNRESSLIIFDELHKMKMWKSWLKGVYDTEGIPPSLVVTGSARLDVFRKGGDSLAGRHRLFHLHPFSVAELSHLNPDDALEKIMSNSGFPEPFLASSEKEVNLWRRSHLDVILREDLMDLENVRDIRSIEILIELLSERVGSSISYSSLAEDLSVSSHTVKKWIQILEYLHVIFLVLPYSKNIAKAISKQPKIYFYDLGRVENGDGARLENVVACHLLKRNHFLLDTLGVKHELFYIRDKEKREIDFMTTKGRSIEYLIEVKKADDHFSNYLNYYHERLNPMCSYQVVHEFGKKQTLSKDKQIVKMSNFLGSLEA